VRTLTTAVVVLPRPVLEERPDQLAQRLRVGGAEAHQVADLVVKVAIPLPNAPAPAQRSLSNYSSQIMIVELLIY